MNKTNNIINMGVIAHINAGKTTTVENILYKTGSIKHKGDVDEGTSVTDFLTEEKDHGITIKSSVVSCLINDLKINIIDTPGHIDFSVEVQRILNVIDFALVIIDVNHGVQAQTEFLFNLAKENKKPMILFLNKFDKNQISFDKCVENIEKALKIKLLPITFPHYEKDELSKIVSVIDNNDNYYKEIVEIYKDNLINSIDNDEIIEDFINNKVDPKEFLKNIDCMNNIPLFSGSSKKNIGLDLLLQGIYNMRTKFIKNQKKKLNALYIFKFFPHYENNLFYCNILTDNIKKGDIYEFHNNKNDRLKIQNIFKPFGVHLEETKELFFNDIAVINCISDRETNLLNGSCISKNKIDESFIQSYISKNNSIPIILMNINFENEDGLNNFLKIKEKILLDDPSLDINYNSESDQYIVGGIGELQLEIFKEKLSHHYNINIVLSNPKVAYKTNIEEETLLIDDSVLFANSTVCIKFKVDIKISNAQKPKLILPDREIEYSFSINDLPVINNDFLIKNLAINNNDLNIEFSDDLKTNFIINLLNKNLSRTTNNVLEPIMILEIKTNHIYTGTITTDLIRKEGEILNIEYTDDFEIINAEVPFRNLIGYTTHFRDITNGRAFFTMKLFKYKNTKNIKTD